MFPGFSLEHVDVGPVRLRVRHGGSGPPVVLLHGHPRTHATWHRVAPLLAERHTVICPDLRGYGGSTAPPDTADHSSYAKRAMAADVVALLDALGHERAAVIGHDRGCYVAMRTALDHPDRVSRLGVLDGVPIGEALARADARFAARWWHWFFLGQLDKPAERIINADPDAWYGGSPERMGAQAYADYRRAIHDPATVHAMCEDYRAGLGPDRAADEADRAAGRRIGCPVLFVWSERDDLVELHGDPAAIWRRWADDLRVASVDSGHHMAEEAPEQLVGVLADFLAL
ncbi:alpha/beta hydrolase [Micromonospora sp. 15K316]|uniref:alpha/beta fold hydrolase n=1 Tax=Micromonospora sp. 15K316 TaxID=2530376 RepID=UPI001047988E|nr:alpha/beta hydrolase [Micromonospora sp. 15K316]TDC32770.1 alpha/beta hydrolase [Micromonospora sp. 15K316]